jgi:hypothetical protein
VSMSDELKERNILKLMLIVRFACAILDVGHPIYQYLRGMRSPLGQVNCSYNIARKNVKVFVDMLIIQNEPFSREI